MCPLPSAIPNPRSSWTTSSSGSPPRFGEDTRYLALAAISAGTVYQFVSGRIKLLAESETVATLLPACDLPTREELAPGRKLIDAENAINLAYRPGMPITWQTWVDGEKFYG